MNNIVTYIPSIRLPSKKILTNDLAHKFCRMSLAFVKSHYKQIFGKIIKNRKIKDKQEIITNLELMIYQARLAISYLRKIE